MIIVALGHRRNVGKDTLAKIMETQLTEKGYTVKRASFAEKLYDLCYQMFGWAGFETKEYYETHRDQKESILSIIGKSPREILIEVGLLFRQIYGPIWIEHALAIAKDVDYLIITDLRFPNEFAAVKTRSGYCVLVTRNVPRSNDPSDCALEGCSNWDHIIFNDGTPEGLAIASLDLIARITT